MIKNLAKKKARKLLIQNKLYALTAYNDLQRIIESNQFTIIAYKKHTNAEPVSALIKKLKVEAETQHSDAFLYMNNNLKFLFINADVSEEEKCALLRHELGHICDPDLNNTHPLTSRIGREEFANEFSFYTKNPGLLFRLYVLILKKWKVFVGALLLILCILGLFFMLPSLTMNRSKSVTTDVSALENSEATFYVTSSGKKYHRKHCIIIKYKNNVSELQLDDAVKRGFSPCMICNPEERE